MIPGSSKGKAVDPAERPGHTRSFSRTLTDLGYVGLQTAFKPFSTMYTMFQPRNNLSNAELIGAQIDNYDTSKYQTGYPLSKYHHHDPILTDSILTDWSKYLLG